MLCKLRKNICIAVRIVIRLREIITVKRIVVYTDDGVDRTDLSYSIRDVVCAFITDGQVKQIAVALGAVTERILDAHTIAIEIMEHFFTLVADKHYVPPKFISTEERCAEQKAPLLWT